MANKITFYKIFAKDSGTSECYVGSTNNFGQRKRSHKSRCYNQNQRGYNTPLYQFIRDHGGFDNFKFENLETREVENKDERNEIEKHYIEECGATLNKEIPGRTHFEWRTDNREKISERRNVKFNCDCGGKYTYSNKSRHFKSQIHIKSLESLLEQQTIVLNQSTTVTAQALDLIKNQKELITAQQAHITELKSK